MAEMTIKRFGVFSVAKMQALLGFVIGLILGVIYGLIFIALGATMSSLGGRDAAAGGVPSIVMGIGFMIGLPIVYTVVGFIGGCIGALVYNGAAGMIGGVKFELEGVNPEYTPPPPPQQWAPSPYPPR
ncbi:MAG TPA: hypothetical protein VKB46_05680 [Pyrinomonadaceae bacterium]|nr:hypothetical protein [Pyrinomonadaceae bacterium]